jgi:hypothetical protein
LQPMGLSRIAPASVGLCELQTYGCKDCRVWVTEARERWVSEMQEATNRCGRLLSNRSQRADADAKRLFATVDKGVGSSGSRNQPCFRPGHGQNMKSRANSAPIFVVPPNVESNAHPAPTIGSAVSERVNGF